MKASDWLIDLIDWLILVLHRNRFSGFRRTIRDVASRGGPLSPAKEDKVAVENKIEQENLEKSMELVSNDFTFGASSVKHEKLEFMARSNI